ncbi:hypothetical protein GCM10020219_101390 [Nonomuraea dietziae]
MCGLFHAAATSDGTIHDVLDWLANPADPAPVEALRQAGAIGLAGDLQSTIRLPAETRGGVYSTAAQTMACLLDPVISKWITPDPGKPQFDPEDFVTGSDTLYLFSKKGRGGAAPLVAAFADAVLQAAISAAERAGGRNDPPLVAILDEAANIAPDRRLARSVFVPRQPGHSDRHHPAELSAGRPGVGAGRDGRPVGRRHRQGPGRGALDDSDFAEKISRLIGEHRITETSVSHSRQGRSVSHSSRKERIYSAADVRALPKGTALLLLTGIRAAVITLRPWMAEPYADRLRAATKRAERDITRRALRKRPQRSPRSRPPTTLSRR